MRWPLCLAALALLSAGAFAAHAARGGASALAEAKQEAEAALRRYRSLDLQARRATSQAERARAEGEALAARIEAAEAELTAAERRIAMVEALLADQRSRLAARQQPLVRLTAALQTMARRPAALALVSPGSVQDTIHVRTLLAATLPEIRRRTADLRAEVERGQTLRRQSERARAVLLESRETLKARRIELARFELARRSRSQALTGLALAESDRALAFGEEARALAQQGERRRFRAALGERLATLSGPIPRPGAPSPGETARPTPYLRPVEGRLVTGVGEISDGGVHSRGLTFETAPAATIRAPGAGRVAFAGRFGGYDNVVIIDHGRGWSSVLTHVTALSVAPGQTVRRGDRLGQAGEDRPRVSLELRREGRPVPVAQLIGG